MPRLRQLRDLADYWVEINRLENQADRSYRKLLGEMFDDVDDAVQPDQAARDRPGARGRRGRLREGRPHRRDDRGQGVLTRWSSPSSCSWSAIALAFDYTNGFHDAANAIATSVSTRALTPRVALAMAAVFNLIGALLGEGVAKTIGSGIVDPRRRPPRPRHRAWPGCSARSPGTSSPGGVGLPSSSSHALIGGLAGSGIAAATTVHWDVILDQGRHPDDRLAAGRVRRSPTCSWSASCGRFRNSVPGKTNRRFKIAQTVSAAAMALGHGLQDAQKTMGVIVLALVAGGYHEGTDDPAVGQARRRARDQRRHLRRRLADHAHARPPDHRARPAARLRRRDRRGQRALHDGLRAPARRSRPPTPSPRRSWASAPPKRLLGRPLGRRRARSSPPGC